VRTDCICAGRHVDIRSITLSAEMFRQISDALKSDRSLVRDKRGGPRVGLRAEVAILPLGGGGGGAMRLRCRNLSADGIGLLHTAEMRSGTKFIARLEAAGRGEAVHIVCVAAHCARSGPNLFSIGASFLGIISADEAKRLTPTAA
jgi:hypothetical protein